MSRTLLIGLDGATFTVLDALFAAGEMPFLREFLERGAHAELESTVHPLTPAAWTSMITGRTPGNHGVFDFIHCRQSPEGIFFTLNMSYDIRVPTLWSILSRRGLRVAALNFPVAYPPEPLNGICVPGFVHERHLRQAVCPPAFFETMRAIPGFDPTLLSMDMNQEFQSIQQLPPEEYAFWIEHHTRREEHWFYLLRHILTHENPDFAALIFDGVDKLQHLCWRFLDPRTRPVEPTPWEAGILELCLNYFRKLDGLIREIVDAAGPEAAIFVASDHGFGPTEAVFFANTWLAQNGHLYWRDETAPLADGSTSISQETIKSQIEEIDWSRTTAFALNPSSNGIYIRRAERNGEPGVPAADYEAYRASLVGQLQALVDPFTAGPFFSRVLTREQAFPGEFPARAPDITLLMQDHGFLSVLRSDSVFRRRPEPWGTHYPQGIFIAGGRGIAPLGKMPGMQIVDVAPILMRSLGVEPDVAMEGVCRESLFTTPASFPREEPAPGAPASGAAQPADDEAEVAAEVLKRLRAIGYLAQ